MIADRKGFVKVKPMSNFPLVTLQVPTRGMDRQDWLTRRRHSIGGSDAAGVLGLSKWSSPMSVWADKLGRVSDKEDTEAMRLGRDLEDYVAHRWTEATGKRVKRVNAILYNEQHPYAHADLDRMVIGESSGLECKTTSALDLRKFKDVEFPEQYYVQCVHYMAVTGAERWYLAVLVFGRGLFSYELQRDQAEIDALMDAENKFWGYVQTRTPPPADGLPATSDVLRALYQETRGDEVQLYGREAILSEWAELKEQKKALEMRMAAIENTIKADLGECTRGNCQGFLVTWKPQVRRNFQAKAFAADHPDIPLDNYYKATESRPFIIKKEDK